MLRSHHADTSSATMQADRQTDKKRSLCAFLSVHELRFRPYLKGTEFSTRGSHLLKRHLELRLRSSPKCPAQFLVCILGCNIRLVRGAATHTTVNKVRTPKRKFCELRLETGVESRGYALRNGPVNDTSFDDEK